MILIFRSQIEILSSVVTRAYLLFWIHDYTVSHSRLDDQRVNELLEVVL